MSGLEPHLRALAHHNLHDQLQVPPASNEAHTILVISDILYDSTVEVVAHHTNESVVVHYMWVQTQYSPTCLVR